jgi:hypothetical protein
MKIQAKEQAEREIGQCLRGIPGLEEGNAKTEKQQAEEH